MEQIKRTNKVNDFFTSNSRKLVKDGLKNVKGSLSDGELEFIKNSVPNLGKGVISNKELDFIKKLIPNKK